MGGLASRPSRAPCSRPGCILASLGPARQRVLSVLLEVDGEFDVGYSAEEEDLGDHHAVGNQGVVFEEPECLMLFEVVLAWLLDGWLSEGRYIDG